MKYHFMIILFIVSSNCNAKISSDVSLGAAFNDKINESLATAKTGLTYYAHDNAAFGTYLTYFNKGYYEKGGLGVELALIPYIEVEGGNKIFAEIGMRNKLDSYFVGIGNHINTETPFSFTLSSRWYNRIFDGSYEGYYTFNIGLSYQWRNDVDSNLIDSPSDISNIIYEYETNPQVDSVITDDTSVSNRDNMTFKKSDFITYTVKEGDYLYKVSRNHGMSFNELLEVNKQLLEVDNLDLIHPGLIIYVKPD